MCRTYSKCELNLHAYFVDIGLSGFILVPTRHDVQVMLLWKQVLRHSKDYSRDPDILGQHYQTD